MWVLIGIGVVIGALIALGVRSSKREKARIAAMGPEEREHYYAKKEYDRAVSDAKRKVSDAEKAYTDTLDSIAKDMKVAQGIGTGRLERLRANKVLTLSGTGFKVGSKAYPLDASYQAAVTTGKAGTADAMNAYLKITSIPLKETFTLKAADADKARAFATALTSAARTSADTSKSRSLQVSALERQLEAAKRATGPIDEAKKALKAAEKNTGRLDAAKKAWDIAKAKPASPLDGPAAP